MAEEVNKSSRHDLMMNYLNAVREFGYCSPEVAEAYEKLVESKRRKNYERN